MRDISDFDPRRLRVKAEYRNMQAQIIDARFPERADDAERLRKAAAKSIRRAERIEAAVAEAAA